MAMLSGLVNRARAYWKGPADRNGEILQEALTGDIPFEVIANVLGENMYDASRLNNEERRNITKPEYWHARNNAVSAWLLFSRTTKSINAAARHEDMQQSVFVRQPLLVDVLEYYLAHGDVDNFLRLHMTPDFYAAWVAKGRPLDKSSDFVDPELLTSWTKLIPMWHRRGLRPTNEIFEVFNNQPVSKISHLGVLILIYEYHLKKLCFGLGRAGPGEKIYHVLNEFSNLFHGLIRPAWIIMGLYEGGHVNVLTALRAELDQGRSKSILAGWSSADLERGFARVLKRVLERDEHDLLGDIWTKKSPPDLHGINVGTTCAHLLLSQTPAAKIYKLMPLLNDETCAMIMDHRAYFSRAPHAFIVEPLSWCVMTEPVARVVRALMPPKPALAQPRDVGMPVDLAWLMCMRDIQIWAIACARTDLLDSVFEVDRLNPGLRNELDNVTSLNIRVTSLNIRGLKNIQGPPTRAIATYPQVAALLAFVKKRGSLFTGVTTLLRQTCPIMKCTDAEWKLLFADPLFRDIFQYVPFFLSSVALDGLSDQTIRALIDVRQTLQSQHHSVVVLEAYHLFTGNGTVNVLDYFLAHFGWTLHNFLDDLVDHMRMNTIREARTQTPRAQTPRFMDFVCFVAKHAAPAESADHLRRLADIMLIMDGNGPRRVVRLLDTLAAAKKKE